MTVSPALKSRTEMPVMFSFVVNAIGEYIKKGILSAGRLDGATLESLYANGKRDYSGLKLGRVDLLKHPDCVIRGADISLIDKPLESIRTLDTKDCTMSGLNAAGEPFTRVSFQGMKLQGAILAGCPFVSCNFVGADLTSANLKGATFTACMVDSTTTISEGSLDSCSFFATDFSVAKTAVKRSGKQLSPVLTILGVVVALLAVTGGWQFLVSRQNLLPPLVAGQTVDNDN